MQSSRPPKILQLLRRLRGIKLRGVKLRGVKLPRLPRSRWRILASVVLLGLVAAAGIVALTPNRPWGGVLVLRKAAGFLPEVSWTDVEILNRADLGFDVGRLARHGQPYAELHDPFVGVPEGLARGKEIFTQNCVKCHGENAKGGFGPALDKGIFKHGGSDWALYETINGGVQGTAMVGGFIPRADVWYVIAYLRGLEEKGGTHRRGPEDGEVALEPAKAVTPERLLESSTGTGEWLLPGGSYDGQRFSRDGEINRGNISQLAVQWVHQLPTTQAPNETTPVVNGSYMYIAQPPGTVYALDVRTGQQVWRYVRPLPGDLRLCCLATTRGVSVSGSAVYVGTQDAHLLALDASTGQLLWDRKVADYTEGYSILSPPLPVGDLIVTGIAGGEFPTKGFIVAYDAQGNIRWRFDTIPADGDPAAKTWAEGSLKAGAPTWGVGAYDPELGLLYWGVGCAAPDFNNQVRQGDNLYSSSMLALDAKTGTLRWHFQFLPGDDHDWDSIQTPSLIDVVQDGVTQKWLAVANRGGFFYVLDRQTGRFIRGAPFSKQTWAKGLDPVTGRPIREPNTGGTPEGTQVFPSLNGATNWWPSAYSPSQQLYYVSVEEGGGLFYRQPAHLSRGKPYLGGTGTFGTDNFSDLVRAIDPLTAQVRWERKNATVTSAPRGGLLATAGDLLFGSDGPRLYALDAATGEERWSFWAGAHISAPPMTYRSTGPGGSRQVVAVVAGQDVITFALPQTGTAQPATPAAEAHAVQGSRTAPARHGREDARTHSTGSSPL